MSKSVRKNIKYLIEALPGGKTIINEVDRYRRQKDWSRVIHLRFARTRLSFYTSIGLGDQMVARQFCKTFQAYCEKYGDPGIGYVVKCAGAWTTDFRIKKGDLNLYWWWSMNGREDWLDHYLNNINIKPDGILCLSNQCMEEADKHCSKVLFLPLGVGENFYPLSIARDGTGFAGSKGHKDPEQEDIVLGPFIDSNTLEWVDNIDTDIALNQFYNRKKIILGMTENIQEKWGMVNNRVFEVLASGTPFIMHNHHTINDILGFEFPYQSGSRTETEALAREIHANYTESLDKFRDYSRIVMAKHSYTKRIEQLIRFIHKET